MKVLSLALLVALLPIAAGATTLSNGVSSVTTTSAVFSVGASATNTAPSGVGLPRIWLVYGRQNKGTSFDDWQYKVNLGVVLGLNSNITYSATNLRQASGSFFAFRSTENSGTNYEWTVVTALQTSNTVPAVVASTTLLRVNSGWSATLTTNKLMVISGTITNHVYLTTGPN